MHRAISRAIRGTCRKWRESECPAVSGEEVRQNGHKKNEDFIPPPKYTLTDAVGWATGLVLAYEFTHRRRRTTVIEECPIAPTFSQLKSLGGITTNCPFGWPTTAITQPILSQSVVDVKSRNDNNLNKSQTRTSIDLTPFIREDGLSALDFDSVSNSRTLEDEDDSVQFSNEKQEVRTFHLSNLTSSFPLTTTKEAATDREPDRLSSAGKLTGDLLSVLGAFKFLSSQTPKVSEPDQMSWAISLNDSVEEPPLTAMELMEKGAELGSSRALYNIGVTYERRNEFQIARDYYRKASDLGHPLATYNSAVFLLRDGRISEGLALMQIAAENGVPEAKNIICSN